MLTKINDMAYEIDGDEITIEQDSGGGETTLVLLHRWHVAHVAELMGIVQATSDDELQKTVTTLTRRLLVLRDRIDHLADCLENDANSGHADLAFAETFARATADIANEFCIDLPVTPPKPAQSEPE